MWPRISTWTAETAAVFAKEWRCEFRTRYSLNTLALFAVTTLVTVSFGLGPVGTSRDMASSVLPVVLWIILLFAATAGLPRTFVHEEETHTATALRLAATPSSLFCGKLLYSVTLLLALEALVVPLFITLMQLPVAEPPRLALVLGLGGYGLAVASTLIAAIIAQAEGKSTLFAVLAFPVLLPLFILLIDATRAAVVPTPSGVALGPLVLYDLTVTIAGLMLFPVVWNP
jgi:heme exporter protein B